MISRFKGSYVMAFNLSTTLASEKLAVHQDYSQACALCPWVCARLSSTPRDAWSMSRPSEIVMR